MLKAGVGVSPDTYCAGFFFLFLFFGVIPGNTQGLLLTLHSGFTEGTIWDAGDPTILPNILSLQPPPLGC